MPEICEEKSKIYSSFKKRVESLSSEMEEKHKNTKSILKKSDFLSTKQEIFDETYKAAINQFYLASKKIYGKYFLLNAPDGVFIKKVCSDIFTACKAIADDFKKTCDQKLEAIQKTSSPPQVVAPNFFSEASVKLTDARFGNESHVVNSGRIPKPGKLLERRAKQNQPEENAESISKDSSHSQTPMPQDRSGAATPRPSLM